MKSHLGISKSFSPYSYEPEEEYCLNPQKYFQEFIKPSYQTPSLIYANPLHYKSYRFRPYYNIEESPFRIDPNNPDINPNESNILFLQEIIKEMSTDFKMTQEINFENYKVNPCKLINKQHDPKHCPYYHSHMDKRRNFKMSNYSIEKCLYYETGKCFEDCRYCHTLVEKLYHPLKYKTKFCNAILKKEGKCEYNHYCGFAHSINEIRAELIDDMERNDLFYIYYFKTLWCPYTDEHNKSECIYAHNWQDFRRRPDLFTYKAEPCPNWKSDKYIGFYNEGCPKQHTCLYAHGWKEPQYHPNFYKTMPCQDGKKCSKQRDCPYFHSSKERRNNNKEGTNTMKIPPLRKGNMSVVLTNINFIKERENIWKYNKNLMTPQQKISQKFSTMETQHSKELKIPSKVGLKKEKEQIFQSQYENLSLKLKDLSLKEEKSKKESKLTSIPPTISGPKEGKIEEVPETIIESSLAGEDLSGLYPQETLKISNNETTIGEASTKIGLKETILGGFTKSPIFFKIHEKSKNINPSFQEEIKKKIEEDPDNEASETQERIEESQ